MSACFVRCKVSSLFNICFFACLFMALEYTHPNVYLSLQRSLIGMGGWGGGCSKSSLQWVLGYRLYSKKEVSLSFTPTAHLGIVQPRTAAPGSVSSQAHDDSCQRMVLFLRMFSGHWTLAWAPPSEGVPHSSGWESTTCIFSILWCFLRWQ